MNILMGYVAAGSMYKSETIMKLVWCKKVVPVGCGELVCLISKINVS